VTTIPRADAVALTKALVASDSQNPSLVPGGAGEAAVARLLADILREWGFNVELQEAAPGRPNVIARVGDRGNRSIMFNGHLDVVGVAGMTHAPFDPVEKNGRLYGRGSADMKAGIAAMCAAAARAADAGLAGEIVIAAVCDEEFTSIGTRTLIERGVRADAAIAGAQRVRLDRREVRRSRRAWESLRHRRRRDQARGAFSSRARSIRIEDSGRPRTCTTRPSVGARGDYFRWQRNVELSGPLPAVDRTANDPRRNH
jgi:acetylornithine deacetylase/succinyl-diaminopimelate desuccinylase-like protein